MEQYTTTVPMPQRVTRVAGSDDGQSGLLSVEEPLRAEILTAIQGSRVALEGKIETVAVEVNLLRADLRKVSDKVKVVEGSIVELQAEVGTLRKQMAQAGSTVGRLEARLEDAPGEIILDCWASHNTQRGLWSRPSWKTGSGMCCSLWVSLECFWLRGSIEHLWRRSGLVHLRGPSLLAF
ncbi:hypothetical protein NDU88_004387 [Pleurodeles waltl]|uniref:Uncharacterized protein n=1 Tax=Pleurodeles waltl TaxID=8319 RepID=A0AAV7LI30_PLEWA|nr:hypothetical protein NDU88_004387 [Pleurodeles waltl]